jgi:pimeloyl-ACP methyl ester carboxylesterase
MIVADNSMFDMGTLGQMGFVPGWPGADVYPPQPMVSQTRAVLAKYAEQNGRFQEVVVANAAHSPHIEQPAAFLDAFIAHLRAA